MFLRRRNLWVLSLLAAIAFATQGYAQKDSEKDEGYRPAPSPHAEDGAKDLTLKAGIGAKVIVIPIDRTVELGLAAFVRRAVEEHEDAAVLILDVNTLGGRVDAAIQIRDALLDAKPKTVAFIHPRAISAGALISLACKNIVMSKGSTIGAATPIQGGGGEQAVAVEEKYVSYMRAEMRTTAEANGRRGDIAEAMVDREVVIDGIIDAGKLLTLDNSRAIELHVADAQASSIDEVLELLGLDSPNVERVAINWGEEVARWLTEPMLSGLLLSVGMLGVMIAFYTRSVGPLTIIGFICLGLFFGGHAIVHLVGWEEALLFGTGLVLILIEIAFVPGLGLPGILGGLLLLVALVMSLTALPLDVSFKVGELADAMSRVVISMLGSLVLIAIAGRFILKSALGRGLVLENSQAGHLSAPTAPQSEVGKNGVALTDLRPTGKISIDGTRYDASSEREFIARGESVRVLRTEGPTLIVRKVESDA